MFSHTGSSSRLSVTLRSAKPQPKQLLSVDISSLSVGETVVRVVAKLRVNIRSPQLWECSLVQTNLSDLASCSSGWAISFTYGKYAL